MDQLTRHGRMSFAVTLSQRPGHLLDPTGPTPAHIVGSFLDVPAAVRDLARPGRLNPPPYWVGSAAERGDHVHDCGHLRTVAGGVVPVVGAEVAPPGPAAFGVAEGGVRGGLWVEDDEFVGVGVLVRGVGSHRTGWDPGG